MKLDPRLLLTLALTATACDHPGSSDSGPIPVGNDGQLVGEETPPAEGAAPNGEVAPAETAPVAAPASPKAGKPDGATSQLVGPTQAIRPVTYKLEGAGEAAVQYALSGTGCDSLAIDAATGVVSGAMGATSGQSCAAKIAAHVDGKSYDVGELSVRVPAKYQEWCEALFAKQLYKEQGNTVAAMLFDINARYLAGNFVFLVGNATDCANAQKAIDDDKVIALTLCDKSVAGCTSGSFWRDEATGWRKITDAGPIASVPSLILLDVPGNELTDISPLRNLTKIQFLTLSNNKITSLNALSAWSELYDVKASNNQIEDVTPLAGLSRLFVVNLENNRIGNLAPLKDSGAFIGKFAGNRFDEEGFTKTEENCPTTGSFEDVASFCRL